MNTENMDSSMVSAIESNDWNEMYKLATKSGLTFLRIISNMFQDKVDPGLFLKMSFEKKDNSQEVYDRKEYKFWLKQNKEHIKNEYMRIFLESYDTDGSEAEISGQTSALQNLSKEFPARWEAFLSLSFSHRGNPEISLQYLSQARELAPNKEFIYLWSMILTKNTTKRIEAGSTGYNLHKSNLFLFWMALDLERSERLKRLKTAKEYYQKIIMEEPDGSYIRKLAEKNLKSMLKPFVVIIGYIIMLLCAIVGLIIGKGLIGLIIGAGIGWLLRFPVAMITGSFQAAFNK